MPSASLRVNKGCDDVALASCRPQERRLRITPRRRFHQRLQVSKQRRVLVHRLFAVCPTRSTNVEYLRMRSDIAIRSGRPDYSGKRGREVDLRTAIELVAACHQGSPGGDAGNCREVATQLGTSPG